jgi:hypothetical protein
VDHCIQLILSNIHLWISGGNFAGNILLLLVFFQNYTKSATIVEILQEYKVCLACLKRSDYKEPTNITDKYYVEVGRNSTF